MAKNAKKTGPEVVPEFETAKLVICPWNPRRIAPEQKNALVDSLKRFGQVQPLVVNRRGLMVLGGNQRLDALRELGIKTTPVVLVDLAELEAKALNLALNRIAGEWDYGALEVLLRDLGKDQSLAVGFSEVAFKNLVEAVSSSGGSIPDLQVNDDQDELAPPFDPDRDEKVTCPKCHHCGPLKDFLEAPAAAQEPAPAPEEEE